MNRFDLEIMLFFNSFANQSKAFDEMVCTFASNPLVKGGFVIPILWWLWFRNRGEYRDKEYVLATLIACFIAIFVARTLSMVLPFRPRPVHNPAIHFVLPYSADPTVLSGWSAFPSDHAALFFVLATGILLLSRWLGICAYVHSFIFICLPRIYLGLHQPTDIVAGAALGILLGMLIRFDRVRWIMTHRALRVEEDCPGFFYVCFFFVSYQVVLLFDPIRHLARGLVSCVKHLT
ncbi:phosphatase PAP2 family protein [Geomonas sp. RF6]|uniref:phosphatase PAP2 family protein n=1 Tax=Geomonas sp. RF6 TaxID=2897342 RepID=UPI001E4CA340|nr:phosphatase PAP2 family protein [Geomonas sp. RF6]UFS70742.1 phosphatase PAP2 family protein [Geomonas sp. RF6]